MPGFKEVGFVGDELTKFKENVRTKHASGFYYMEQAQRFGDAHHVDASAGRFG